MESQHVIQLEARSHQRQARDAGSLSILADDGPDERTAEDALIDGLGHRELDELLLREARRASEALLKASAALHAASCVVLEAVAALRKEREQR